MYKIIIPLIAASSMATCLPAEEKKEESKPDVAKLSEALGHMIGKNLLDMGVNLDIAQVIKGLKDSNHGKASPLSETECAAAITCAQEQSFNEKATKNLALAEAFLEKQKDKEGIISIEEGKIQYRIESKGTGPAVEPHSIPTVKYSGKFLDGKEFGSSKEAEPLALDELIPGMKLGMIGMKEGEKRTVYIHPSLGYGTAGMLPPNSLLCFEVEVVKVAPQNNASLPEMTAEVEECDEGDLL